MPINKIIYEDNVLIDLTEDTVTPDTLVKGVTAHDKAGALIEGTIEDYDGSFDGEATEGGASGLPIEVTNADEMTALLTEDNIGKIYKYTGETTEVFVKDEIYIVVEEAE